MGGVGSKAYLLVGEPLARVEVAAPGGVVKGMHL